MRRDIVHLTTVHSPRDVRIFLKECRSAAAAGHAVHLLAPGAPDAFVDGVRMRPLPPPYKRAGRMAVGPVAAFRQARRLGAAIYHFHDPELLPVGLALGRSGARVIYDVHENLPLQVLTKHWIPASARATVARTVDIGERLAGPRLAATVAATPAIAQRMQTMSRRTVLVANYPLREELATPLTGHPPRERAIVYAGGITAVRGVREVVQALEFTSARLLLAGVFTPVSLRDEISALPGWSKVDELGFVDRSSLRDLFARAAAGVVLFQPAPNHVEALPNKLFEYMSSGLPVIASNFPSWRAIVDRYDCGVCVDPTDPAAISTAVEGLLSDPARARRLGLNGRRAVESELNWDSQAANLLALYEELLAEPAR